MNYRDIVALPVGWLLLLLCDGFAALSGAATGTGDLILRAAEQLHKWSEQ